MTAVGYSDTARGQTPNCPAVRWFIHRSTTGDLSGYFFYTDASGVSQAAGKFDPATGQFHMTVTNLDGNGPVGTASGARNPDGLLNGQLTGSGCANVTLRMSPQVPTVGPSAG